MSGAPVCHIPVNQTITDQPRPARFPPVPAAVDLASAIAAINSLRLIVQQLTGQLSNFGQNGLTQGPTVGGGSVALQGRPGAPGRPGKNGKSPKGGRFIEDRSQRVEVEETVYQNDDPSTGNFVVVKRLNQVVWQDNVTGELIVWQR